MAQGGLNLTAFNGLSAPQRAVLALWCQSNATDRVALQHEIASAMGFSYQRAGQHLTTLTKQLGTPLAYCRLVTRPGTTIPTPPRIPVWRSWVADITGETFNNPDWPLQFLLRFVRRWRLPRLSFPQLPRWGEFLLVALFGAALLAIALVLTFSIPSVSSPQPGTPVPNHSITRPRAPTEPAYTTFTTRIVLSPPQTATPGP